MNTRDVVDTLVTRKFSLERVGKKVRRHEKERRLDVQKLQPSVDRSVLIFGSDAEQRFLELRRRQDRLAMASMSLQSAAARVNIVDEMRRILGDTVTLEMLDIDDWGESLDAFLPKEEDERLGALCEHQEVIVLESVVRGYVARLLREEPRKQRKGGSARTLIEEAIQWRRGEDVHALLHEHLVDAVLDRLIQDPDEEDGEVYGEGAPLKFKPRGA